MEEVVLLYLLTQPFSFGSNCCCIATETYITCFMVHGCCSTLRPPFQVVLGLDGYSTLYQHIGDYLSVIFRRRSSWSEDEHSCFGNAGMVTASFVWVDSCMVWFLRMLLHFICLFNSQCVVLRNTTIPHLQDFFDEILDSV